MRRGKEDRMLARGEWGGKTDERRKIKRFRERKRVGENTRSI